MGDIDGDGDLDFVTASNSSGSIMSLGLNDGTGNFTVGSIPIGGGNGYYMTTGDVDGDGDLDLLMATPGVGTVSIYLNDGTGSFPGGTSVTVGYNPYSVAVGDVDGDGDLDFVTANGPSGFNINGTVSVRLNSSFYPRITGAIPASGLPSTRITLLGDNLTGASTVTFAGSNSPVVVTTGIIVNAAGTELTVVVPTGAITGPVTITTPVGISNWLTFTVLSGLATNNHYLAAQTSVYPNPTAGSFTLKLPPVPGATQATSTLLNALGQVVKTRVLALSAGGTTVAYSTVGLAAGVYALRLQAGAETATLRVVVE